MEKQSLYIQIASIIEDQIVNGTFLLGEKLPSIRTLQKNHNVSINTVKQAFLELESRSLIEPRPRSGYFVSKTSQRKLALPSIAQLHSSSGENNPDDLISKVFSTIRQEDVTQFSLGVPAQSFLPTARLKKGMIRAINKISDAGTAYETVQGSINLRRSVAKWSTVFGGKMVEDDIVTTSGAMNAIFNCLLSVTKPGDTIAIETPAFFGLIQIAKSMGLNIIEVPSHPVTGIEIEALKKIIPKIKACCITANFSNPLGSLMPDEHKRELVKLMADYNVPLIEDDLYGNIFFGPKRPLPCKAFDEEGIVMWCSSVSKTLAPGYRVGWVAPGRFKQKIIRQKLLQTTATPILYEEVVSDFMEHGAYDQHMRNFRNQLYSNCLQFQRAIEDDFPDSTKISQPQGGFVLWLELDKKIDTGLLFDTAIKQKISFSPGKMFTVHNQYNNCMRLSFALEWNQRVERDLKKLGQLIKNY